MGTARHSSCVGWSVMSSALDVKKKRAAGEVSPAPDLRSNSWAGLAPTGDVSASAALGHEG
jgi:hypothetical protein